MKSASRKRLCDYCNAKARWQMVYGDGDSAACGRHLSAVLREVTEDGWVKIDRANASEENDPSEHAEDAPTF